MTIKRLKRRVGASLLWPLLFAADAIIVWAAAGDWQALRAQSDHATRTLWGR